MPTYDYRCTACGHELELFQSITAPALEQCPHCSSFSLQRGMGGGSVTLRFTGTGFYTTDYKKCPPDKTTCCPCSNKNVQDP